jgi:hypothetical protein
MRRAYITADEPFDHALARALEWAGDTATIHAPDTATVEDEELDTLGIPVTSSSRKSRFYGQPHGSVIAVGLNLAGVLDVERHGRPRGPLKATVDGLVVTDAYGPQPYSSHGQHHSAWITAFDVDHLGGSPIPAAEPAPAPLRAAIHDLTTRIAVRNQGFLDKRERHAAVHALTYLRDAGHPLDPDALMVEALRNEWGGNGPEDVRQIALDLHHKNLKYDTNRVTTEQLRKWTATTD